MGTHGYMAPEVLSKGTAYDSSADWFSFGCMLYKLLKGHSPFRQHKTKDKHEIDRMTLTMNVELPDTFSLALRQLLEGLLQVRNNLQIIMYTQYIHAYKTGYIGISKLIFPVNRKYNKASHFIHCNWNLRKS